ncbi:MAG: hypothetical protein AVDCRST_MAG93-1969, partial [uncultured Chloroflexia bacterium]
QGYRYNILDVAEVLPEIMTSS